MKTSVNIRPSGLRRQQVLRLRAAQWSKVLCVALVGGWIAHGYVLSEHRGVTQRLERITREQQPSRNLLRQLIAKRAELAQLAEQEVATCQLGSQRHVLTLLHAVSQAARQTGGRLRVTKLDLTDFQHVGATGKAGAAATPGSMLVAGESLDNSAVAELHVGLQASGLFRRVELLTSKERDRGEAALCDYEVRCDF